jgi:protein-disulfide isomerase
MTAAPFRLAAAALAATLLAACGGEPAKPQSDFTPVPVTPVLGDVPIGSETATVTLVEYAALTCHACRDFAKQIYPRLKREYIDTGKVKYIYRDFPLEADPTSGKAVDGFGVVLASVARCKGPEKYHDLVDGIFTAQADLLDAAREGKALPILAAVAEQNGMTIEEMRTCIDHQPELNASIKKSRDDAATEKNVNSTPTLFLNDERLENRGWDFVKAAIDAKLAGLPIPSADAGAPAPASTPATPVTETPAPAAPATPPAE